MGIVLNDESEYAKELKRWNTPKRLGGYGPDGYEPFPAMLYKAFRHENGQTQCMEPPPQMYEFADMPSFMRAEAKAKAFTDRCQLTVRSQAQFDIEYANGWRKTAEDAIAHFEALQREIADAAAEEQFRVRRMSDAAQRELAAANAATEDHVVEVPIPRKKPGRKPRVVEVGV